MSSATKSYVSIIFLTICWVGIQMNMAFDETQFPLKLSKMVTSPFLIATALTMGPLSGIIIQPLLGWYSDQLQRRRISRLCLIGVAGGGAIFSILWLPIVKTFGMMVASLGVYYLFMNILMVMTRAFNTEASNTPDLTPYKSSISGFISLFSGVGAFAMYLISSQWGGTPLPFQVGAAVLLFSVGLFLLYAPRPNRPIRKISTPSAALFSGWHLLFYFFPPINLLPPFERRLVQQDYQRPMFRLFLVVYLSWLGFQAVRAFFLLYAQHHLHFSHAWANYLLAMTTFSIMLFSVPLGRLGDKRDNVQLLRYALFLFALICLAFYILSPSQTTALSLCVVLGLSLAGVLTYQLSLLFKLCPPQQEGVYTGLYNVFISIPQLHSLLFTGWVLELAGKYNAILPVGGFFILTAAFCSLRLSPTRTACH